MHLRFSTCVKTINLSVPNNPVHAITAITTPELFEGVAPSIVYCLFVLAFLVPDDSQTNDRNMYSEVIY